MFRIFYVISYIHEQISQAIKAHIQAMMHQLQALILNITVAIICLPVAGAAANRPSSKAILPNMHVNALTQDSLGYIWVGTSNGLCRDKGNGYDIFSSDKANPATIPSNNITALLYRNGTLWVATARGIATKAAHSNEFTRYTVKSEKQHSEGYYRGFITYGGKLYTYGYNGLYEIDPANHLLIPRLQFNRRDIEAAAIAPDGKMWVTPGAN